MREGSNKTIFPNKSVSSIQFLLLSLPPNGREIYAYFSCFYLYPIFLPDRGLKVDFCIIPPFHLILTTTLQGSSLACEIVGGGGKVT